MKPIDKFTTALALQDETETLQALCTELVLARFVAQALIERRDPEAAVLCYVDFLKRGEQRIVPDCFLPAGLRGFAPDSAFIAAIEAYKLGDSTPEPEVTSREQAIANALSEDRQHSEYRVRNLTKALQLVRDVLDFKGELSGDCLGPKIGAALYEVEDLLSLELGQPVWEGRQNTTDEEDAAQLRGEQRRGA